MPEGCQYWYCLNNPFKYTDPSGEYFFYINLGLGWSKDGGFSISLGVGIGFKDKASVGISIGYDFGSGDFNAGVNFCYAGSYTSAGWSSSAGWNVSTGYSYGAQVGIFSVSVFSAGGSYSENGGFSANVWYYNYNQYSGFSVNPSVGIGYSYKFETAATRAARAVQATKAQAEAAQVKLQEEINKIRAEFAADMLTPVDLLSAAKEKYFCGFGDLSADIVAYKRRSLAASAYSDWANERSEWATGDTGPKCNIYVYDKAVGNGMMDPTSTIPQAEIYGNRNSKIAGWSVVTDGTTMMGDIRGYAERTGNSTGHVGIMSQVKVNDVWTWALIYAGSSVTPNQIAASVFSKWPAGPSWVTWRYIGR